MLIFKKPNIGQFIRSCWYIGWPLLDITWKYRNGGWWFWDLKKKWNVSFNADILKMPNIGWFIGFYDIYVVHYWTLPLEVDASGIFYRWTCRRTSVLYDGEFEVLLTLIRIIIWPNSEIQSVQYVIIFIVQVICPHGHFRRMCFQFMISNMRYWMHRASVSQSYFHLSLFKYRLLSSVNEIFYFEWVMYNFI